MAIRILQRPKFDVPAPQGQGIPSPELQPRAVIGPTKDAMQARQRAAVARQRGLGQGPIGPTLESRMAQQRAEIARQRSAMAGVESPSAMDANRQMGRMDYESGYRDKLWSRQDANRQAGQNSFVNTQNSRGQLSSYAQYQNSMAGNVAAGGAAPPYRASQPMLGESRQGLLGGARGSINGRMIGDEDPISGPANPPQVFADSQGKQHFGLQGTKYIAGTRFDGANGLGVSVRGVGGTGLGLKGQRQDWQISNSLNTMDAQGNVVQHPAYAAAAARKQMDKDNHVLGLAAQGGLSQQHPLVLGAMQRQSERAEQQKHDIATTAAQQQHTTERMHGLHQSMMELDKQINDPLIKPAKRALLEETRNRIQDQYDSLSPRRRPLGVASNSRTPKLGVRQSIGTTTNGGNESGVNSMSEMPG